MVQMRNESACVMQTQTIKVQSIMSNILPLSLIDQLDHYMYYIVHL